MNVVLQAEDIGQHLLASVTLPVSLAAVIPGQAPTLLITEVQVGNVRRVELSNVSANAIDISGWRLICYDFQSWPLPKVTLVLPSRTVCAGFGLFVTPMRSWLR